MNKQKPPMTVESVLQRIDRPKKGVVTAGMPYANGPLHLGHLAGAHIPADAYARYLRMLIGKENVVFVCGTDDHGSTSEVAATQQGQSIHEFIESIHGIQKKTLDTYGISLDNYTGTSTPATFEKHKVICGEFLEKLQENGMLSKKTTKQWYDPELKRFLPDRNVRGTCPKCGDEGAYSNECDACGAQYNSEELLNPRSMLSEGTPELKDTDHLWLDMWKVSDVLLEWVQGRKKHWRKAVFNEVINTVLPNIIFSKEHEAQFKELKSELPKLKSRFAPGGRMTAEFQNLTDLETARTKLKENGIDTELVDGWAHRSITRDTTWGIPIPKSVDSNMESKTLYVWPDSLIAPISFSQVALEKRGLSSDAYKDYWYQEGTSINQFLGQDNVFFYALMQGALWIGSQGQIDRMPQDGETQLTDIYGSYHLTVNGEKISKSKGNSFPADHYIEKEGYHPDQIRYYLCLLSLPEKQSNFDKDHFEERNRFLAGPLNASLEKPISACLKKFDGVVPEGKLMEKVEKETYKIVQKYVRSMQKAEYSTLLYAIENYARLVNSMFTQFKPHDDRFPEEDRKNSLYSCFAILKNLMIMLYPFAPFTMDKLRKSLNLPKEVFSIDELGKPIEAGHQIGEMDTYFPAVDEA